MFASSTRQLQVESRGLLGQGYRTRFVEKRWTTSTSRGSSVLPGEGRGKRSSVGCDTGLLLTRLDLPTAYALL